MVNRQRFLRRYRKHIKKAVSDAVDKRSITDVESGEHISIPSRDLSEPLFQHGSGGRNTRVLPGNDQFSTGDHIPRPSGGGSGGKAQAPAIKAREKMSLFSNLARRILNFLFEDLALPNLVKRQLSGNEEFEFRRAGVSNEGSPGKINVIRSLRSANSRRIALTAKKRRKLKAIEEQLIQHEPDGDATDSTFAQLNKQAEALREKIKRVPWLDDFDLKYNLQVKYPIPTSKAVMFCLMDVSGSMDQATKDIAKRFFLLLYLFLQRNYEKTDVVFIRHHTSAKEVDEQEFFIAEKPGEPLYQAHST
jgi:Uncharacterized conserved protein